MKQTPLWVAAVATLSAPAWASSCLDDAPSRHDAGPIACIASERYSDPLTLSQLARNDLAMASSRGGEDLIYIRDEIRLGARWGGGILSLLARESATLVANEGAVEVISDISTPGSPATSYKRHVALQFSGFAGVGLGWDSLWWPLAQSWSTRMGVQALSVQRLVGRNLLGDVAYNATTRSYGLQAESEYFNDRLHFPFQRTAAKQGMGLLFNGAVAWQPTEQGWLALKVEDLGRLGWQRLPQESMTLSTDTSRVDADGYLVYKPLVEGRNHQDGYTSRAVATWTLQGKWVVSPSSSSWAIDLKARRIDGYATWLPYAGLSGVANGGVNLSMGWLIHERAASLSASKGGWSLRLAADRLNGSAHARIGMLSWQGDWK